MLSSGKKFEIESLFADNHDGMGVMHGKGGITLDDQGDGQMFTGMEVEGEGLAFHDGGGEKLNSTLDLNFQSRTSTQRNSNFLLTEFLPRKLKASAEWIV
jgi:hypothetical protein